VSSARLAPLPGDRAEALAAAVRAAVAADRARLELRSGMVLAITECLRAGASYARVARVLLRERLGRAPTVAERDREVARLRQLVARDKRSRVSDGAEPPLPCRRTSAAPSSTVAGQFPQIGEGVMAEKIVRKTTTTTVTEEYVDPEQLDGADEPDDDPDDDEPEPPKPRPRRK
jgi:hypothetical protein